MSYNSKNRHLTGAAGRLRRAALLGGVSSMVVGAMVPMAMAQESDEDVIVVTGIRGSLERSMDMKRNANGVVDAISAEDIGKFPDTNLAESLQRITGVSINRVNGEGAEITVRGFGPGFNLVTLNGRTLPTAEVSVVGARGNYNGGGSRSFDFSNLASEGVSSARRLTSILAVRLTAPPARRPVFKSRLSTIRPFRMEARSRRKFPAS